MPEYIERQTLINAIPIVNEDKQISLYGAVADFLILISSIPTADVVEVKHGEWIADRNPVEVAFICSECKYRYFFADPEEECEYNFCPHCGAKMDLKEGSDNG